MLKTYGTLLVPLDITRRMPEHEPSAVPGRDWKHATTYEEIFGLSSEDCEAVKRAEEEYFYDEVFRALYTLDKHAILSVFNLGDKDDGFEIADMHHAKDRGYLYIGRSE